MIRDLKTLLDAYASARVGTHIRGLIAEEFGFSISGETLELSVDFDMSSLDIKGEVDDAEMINLVKSQPIFAVARTQDAGEIEKWLRGESEPPWMLSDEMEE